MRIQWTPIARTSMQRGTTSSSSASFDAHIGDASKLSIARMITSCLTDYSKTIQSSSAFIQHLKSPAHRNEKLQCINCLRYFATATALTQHCESQGSRCKVRQTSEYDGVVDSITGGTAITAGRHIDDTIRYAVNPSITVTGVVDSHRALMEEKNRRKNTFWDKNTPRW